MSQLRIDCGLASSVMPVLRIEVASSCETDKEVVLRNLLKIIDLSIYYKGSLISPEEELIPRTDEQYPIGSVCLLKFESHKDAMNFVRDLRPT